MCFALLGLGGAAAGAAGAAGAASSGISLGSIFSALGTAASVAGTLASAQAQADAANAQAQQDENNAIIAQRNAEDARNRGIVAQQDIQQRTKARLGMQKNALSEKNIAVGSGSALDVLGDTAMFGKLDELTTGANFEREAIAAETQAYNYKAQAGIDSMKADAALTAGGISAFSTALGGVANIYKDSRRGLTA